MVETPFTEEEVKTVVWELEGGKALSPDGFPLAFYKHC